MHHPVVSQDKDYPSFDEVVPLSILDIMVNKYEGEIILVDEPGYVYSKTLVRDCQIEFKNGNKFDGEVFQGLLHGQGMYVWENGMKYIGEFNRNCLTGKGKIMWSDTEYYEGDFCNGMREGQGLYVNEDLKIKYQGSYKFGKRHGFGSLTYSSGECYEGNFIEGLKEGKGKFTYSSGSVYEGDWKNDVKEGYGVMKYAAKAQKYYGEWSNNLQNGWGTQIWLEEKGEGRVLRNRYEGQWVNGVREGIGTFYYANGSKYEGEWKNHMKHGLGILTGEDGVEMHVMFNNDRLIKCFKEISTNYEYLYPRQIIEQAANISNFNASNNSKEGSIQAGTQSIKGNGSKGFQKTNNITEKKNVTIDPNPFIKMIDISDLLFDHPNETEIARHLYEVLLRHNSTFRRWYKIYALKFTEFETENSFGLSMGAFWKFMKDSRVINGYCTIPALNRCFLNGIKNSFPISCNYKELKEKIDLIIKLYAEYKEDIPIIGRLHRKSTNQLIELFSKHSGEFEIHDPKRVLLFRHFVDALVRVAYLKYQDIEKLPDNLDKLVNNQIGPILRGNLVPKPIISDENHIMSKARGLLQDYSSQLLQLFQSQRSYKSKIFSFVQDATITIEELIKMLTRAQMIKNNFQILFTIVERYHDPVESYYYFEKNFKEKSTVFKQLLKKLECELLFSEFCDDLLIYFFKSFNHTMKERNLLAAMKNHFETFLKANQIELKIEEKVKDEIKWPPTIKDELVKTLQERRIKEEEEEKKRKLLKAEQNNEQRERNLMKLEDFDALEPIREEQTKTSEIFPETVEEEIGDDPYYHVDNANVNKSATNFSKNVSKNLNKSKMSVVMENNSNASSYY